METQKLQQNIPSGWRLTSLGSLATKLKTGGTPTSTNKSFYEGEIPFVKIDDMTTSGKHVASTNSHISEEGLKNSSAWLVPKDSILYSIYATVGEVSINSIDVATNQAIMGIVVDEKKASRDYLYQYLLSIKSSLRKHFKETTQKNLTSQIVRELEVIIPESIKEQQKIAEILGMVDEDIAKTQEVIKATEKLKRGLMQQLFTRGIGHIKFKKAEIGEIPTEWNFKKLSKITKQITDGTHRTPNYTEEGTPFLRVTDIQTENIEWSNVKYISLEEHAELIKRCNPQRGDVLLSKNGTIGITKVIDWDREFSIFVSLCLIKPEPKEILSEYLCEILRSDFILSQVRKRSKQGTVTNLHLEEIRDFDIPVPPIPEQKIIIEILSAVDKKISVNKKLKEKLTLLKKGLMQDLLSGNKRVKI